MALFKAQAHMRELKQRLSLQMPGATFAESLDANSFPMLAVTTGAETCFLKIEEIGNAGRVDALGLPQRVYSPHKCSLIQELAATPPAEIPARCKVLAAIAKLGMKIEIYEGTGVAIAADYAAALALSTLVAEIKSDEINPLTSSQ